MVNMKKIGLVTFHRAHNYGAVLQCYALLNIIKKNHDIEIIDYNFGKIYANYKVITPPGKNLIKYVKVFLDDIFNLKRKRMRHKAFQDFISTEFQMGKEYCSASEIINDNLYYEILLTGSDQVWNPGITGGLSDIYTLNFGKKDVKRISYAASLGNEQSVMKFKYDYKRLLSKIDKISVREESAKNELVKILPQKKVEVVLDPTLLLTKEEWDNIISDCKPENEKYILAYVVKFDKNFVKIANELSEKTGLKIIHFGKTNKGLKNICRNAYIEGPLEFVNLIKNAEYVVATSFHATVFSIIFNKKFWIVPHSTTGSRVIDLLKKFEILDRSVKTLEEFKEKNYDDEINYIKVNEILKLEREKSINWLIDAIDK